ncbi:MAG: hypothetical protein IPK26_27200 [Planctomycetes bacterium]|nr:hypothetical protein [Planctomycetota bacterium]
MTVPRRRRILFGFVMLLLLAVLLELAGATTWWWLRGEWFTWQRGDAARAIAANAFDPTADQQQQRERATLRLLQGNLAQHPFLGYVNDADVAAQQAHAVPVSRFGFLDVAPPIRQRGPDRFVVAITGGSVAAQMWDQARGELAAELQLSRAIAGRRVEFVNLALGGWRQPQQLLAVQLVTLLGGEFDLVINLDGFNEVALVHENLPHGVPAWFPRGWARLLDQPTPAQQLRLGRLALARQQRIDAANTAALMRWSALAQAFWLLADRGHDRAIATAAAAVEQGATAPSFAVTGPGTGGLDLPAAWAQMADLWAASSLELAAACARHGTRYCHFLQPNQYVPGSKPIGEAERRVAWLGTHPFKRAVENGYPLLRQRAERLRAGGVELHDLTHLFADHHEPLYTDTCCHLSPTGYALLARRIGATVRGELDLAGVTIAALRASPPELQFTDPLARQELRVLAITDDGREVDITGQPDTTILVPPSQLVRDQHGFRAAARGRAELVVTRGPLRLAVPVRSTWPDRIRADDAFPSGAAPRLTLAEDEPTGTTLAAVCTGLPTGGHRVLVVGLVPIRAEAPDAKAAEHGLALTQLPGDQPSVPVQLPWPDRTPLRDVPMFARVLVLDDKARVIAASNTVVVTRS